MNERALSVSNGLRRSATGVLAYLAMLLVGSTLLYGVFQLGVHVASPSVVESSTRMAMDSGTNRARIAQVLLAISIVVAVARGAGLLFVRLGQPAVMGEVVAGLLLGPTVFGRTAPAAFSAVFAQPVTQALELVAQLGVVIYMFLIGVDLDLSSIKSRSKTVLGISHASMWVPFVVSAPLSLYLYSRYSNGGTTFLVFALFMGVCLSVTAFPVLARILEERNLEKTALGKLALACAAVNDLTAWCILAGVMGLATAHARGIGAVALTSLVFLLVVTFVLHPILKRLARRQEQRGFVSRTDLAIVLVLLLACASATDAIGIHAVFGAFALGIAVPTNSTFAGALGARLADPVYVLLLPLFFAATGLRTELAVLGTSREWLAASVITLVASAGKIGGTYVAARVNGLTPVASCSLGVLMNTRGMVELIVLNVGMELGILSAPLYCMLLLMALVTTMTTAPGLKLLGRLERRESSKSAVKIGHACAGDEC